MGDFNLRALANTAWAFATAGQWDAQLLRAIARAAEQRRGNIKNTQQLFMILWALSRHDSQRDAWSFFGHAECMSISFGSVCFEALLMECEQRGVFEHEIALLKGLKGAAGNYGMEMDVGVGLLATK